MLDDRKADDRERGEHQGQREHVPDIWLASPLVVDGLGDPVEDCDDTLKPEELRPPRSCSGQGAGGRRSRPL